ncbi:hypothetical protein R3W88_026978 [Solanum pinnatisectum]|uniref:NB-ARC domain-containing protein n=1 Tax=Solanum pinnatisectum TaxID=50273 RepID=A0AAV9LFP9_9SOLN|nr:hypothetical protein R3W88_026978 [Solanum pinnatisectum]
MDIVETCGKGTLSSGEPSTKRSITSIYDDDEVVGFEKDAEIIMKKLIQGTKERDVISIYGRAGLGKTTLASKVYNNPSIVNYFDLKAWFAVSQAYNRKMLLVEIFKQVTNDRIKIKEDIIYLIVLDDIWDVEAWEDLELCFPRGENHSEPYSLKFLTVEQSWELLQKKVFRGENCPSDDLLKAGLQVAQHCKGLPLVFILVAGFIAKMEKEASLWLKVASDLSSYVLGEQSLKPCLLYMGLFPEDHKIPMYDLLKLWMAKEFVLNAETENMEEASRNCLSDLLNRSLIMVAGMRVNRDIVYCSLHDVVRELFLRKLIKDNYIQLAVPYNPYAFNTWHNQYSNALEFIAHPKFNTWHNQYSNALDLVVRLRFVRALYLMDMELSISWAIVMQSLTQLRYLALSVKHFKFMKWISHLHNLQTLQLKSHETLHLRADTLLVMTKLRHVNIDSFSVVWEDINDEGCFEECSTTMLENMKSFRTCDMQLDTMNARFWWRFPNPEELGLHVKVVPEFPLFPIPEVHTRLHSLSLDFSLIQFFDSVGWERYFIFLSNLKHLDLSCYLLTEEMVLNIARLKKLESLKLFMGFSFGSNCWDVTNVEFRALKYLVLHFVRMEEWKASEESFPVLEVLFIEAGFKFKEIPPSFADMPTQRLIELSNCIHSLVVSATNIEREIEEDTGCDSLQVVIKKVNKCIY